MQRHYPLDPSTGIENPALAWIDGVPATGTEGSYPGHLLVTNPQDELLNLLAEAGITGSDTDLHQVLRAIRSGQLTTFVDTGAVNSLVIAPITAHTALQKGLPFRVFPVATNTATTVTITVAPLSPVRLKKLNGSDPAIGDIVAGQPIDVVNDGANFRLLCPVTSDLAASSTTLIQNFLRQQYTIDQYTGLAFQASDVGKYFQADAAAHPVVTLPDPATLPDGWWITLESNNTPTGFQTAYVTAPNAQFSILQWFESTAFLMGGNESFIIWKAGTTYRLVNQSPGAQREIHAVGNAASSYALSSTKSLVHDMTRQANGQPALFNMPATAGAGWQCVVPVTGRYRVKGQCLFTSTATGAHARLMVVNSLTPTDSNILDLDWVDITPNATLDTGEVEPLLVLEQGSVLALVVDGAGLNETSARNTFDIYFLGR